MSESRKPGAPPAGRPAPSPDSGAAGGAAGELRMVACVKLGRRLEGLDKPPLKGDLGDKIFAQVSKQAWQLWLEHSTMIINEYRLDPTTDHGKELWMAELDRYFWGEGAQLPPDYVPKKETDDA